MALVLFSGAPSIRVDLNALAGRCCQCPLLLIFLRDVESSMYAVIQRCAEPKLE